LVGKFEGKRLVGRPKHRWEDNIKMNFEDMRWTGLLWLRSVWWWALMNVVINHQAP
jgi:hypothetical protein